MGKLPKMPHKDRIYKTAQIAMGGLRHFENCRDGEIYDLYNMICDKYPILATREEREKVAPVSSDVRQIYADNGALVSVKEDRLYYNGLELRSAIMDGNKTYFVRFGDRAVMMPDKVLLNLHYPILGIREEGELPVGAELYDAWCVAVDDHYEVRVWNGEKWENNGWFAEPMESAGDLGEAMIGDGTIYEKEAKSNTITLLTMTVEELTEGLRIREGDAVELRGMTVPQNNKIAIIREIGRDGDGNAQIRFSEYCFKAPLDPEGNPKVRWNESEISISRKVPDMDILFEHGNRLWGAKGKEIFVSKIGDPRNWNSFDGVASDSWYLPTQGKGSFTAGISYGGYPRFFREGSMVTVYGSIPSGYQTAEQVLLGVKAGEHGSLCNCNGLLFWLSPEGMVIYNGNSYLQEQVFGDWKLRNVIAAADERYYYCMAEVESPATEEPGQTLFRFDTEGKQWTREDGSYQSLTCDMGILYGLRKNGDIDILNGRGRRIVDTEEGNFVSHVEFGDFTDGTMSRKGMNRLRLRIEVEENAHVELWIQYDSTGEWRRLRRVTKLGKGTVTVPVVPRRCDHYRIKLEGYGAWKLHGIERERYFGSDSF